jgi:hypothetical protein
LRAKRVRGQRKTEHESSNAHTSIAGCQTHEGAAARIVTSWNIARLAQYSMAPARVGHRREF